MKKIMTAVAAALFLICGTADAQMTDDQIIEYVQSAAASGKDENQIAQELVLRGVSRSQLERLRDRYQGQQSGSAGSSFGSGYTSSGRTLSSSADRDGYIDYGETGGNRTLSPSTMYMPPYGAQTPYGMYPVESGQLLDANGNPVQGANGAYGYGNMTGGAYGNAYPGAGTMYGSYGTQGTGAYGTMMQGQYGSQEQNFYFDPATGSYTVVPGMAASAYGAGREEIFGHNLFSGVNLTFEPNENVATPEDYKLGPGDEVVIEVWGLNEDMSTQTVSPEGRINISMVGPVYLSGLTIKEAEKKISAALQTKYAGIGGENPGTFVSVSLGNIRTIRVNVMGDDVCSGSIVYCAVNPFTPIDTGVVPYSVAGVMTPVVRSIVAPVCGGVMVADTICCNTTPVPAVSSMTICAHEWLKTMGTVTCELFIS